MPIQIDVSEEALKCLNTKAREELRKVVETYTKDVLNEAGRLEATSRSTNGEPEITSAMVKDANLLLSKGYRRLKKRPLVALAQIIATVSGFIVGILSDMEKLKDPNLLVVFVIALSIALVCTTLVIIKE